MSFFRRFVSVALVVFAVGCASVSSRPPASATEPAVRAAMASFINALNALDVDRMDAAFTDDITAFVPTAQADLAVGRAAVTKIFSTFADRSRTTAPRLNLAPEDERVIASSTLAVVTFQIHDTASPLTRRRTFVFRREGDRWLISHFHASDVMPPAK